MPRKKTVKYEPPGPKEMMGYKRGDVVYCNRYPDGLFSQGTIKWFHEKTGEGPGFTFMCTVTGSYRIALMSDIVVSPTKQQIAKINNAVLRKIRRDNQKPKTK